MSFIKKNLLFCILVVLCLAAFAVGVYITYTASGNVKQAERELNSAETQLNSLLKSDPTPTEENLEAAERNFAELQASLAEIRENLQSGSTLDTSSDGVSVMAGIQQYIFKFQRRVANHKNEAVEPGEVAKIETPENFAFGFDKYVNDTDIMEDPDKVSLLDKQRQILSYLLTQLIASNPQSIDAVEREVLETTGNEKNQNAFSVDPAVSARVPGAIDTMAFSLTFSGYTDALRDFLNALADFDLPIVVRSIEVNRPSGSETVVAPPTGNENGGIFGFFDEIETAQKQKKKPTVEDQKPVIEENISQFRVILEFFEVVLPNSQNQEVTDPA